MRQTNLLEKKSTLLDNGCATCGYELGSSIAGSGRNCLRCSDYNAAQQEIIRKRQAKQDTWKDLATEAVVVAKNEIVVESTKVVVEQTQEELLPVLAKALKPHLQFDAAKVFDQIDSKFFHLAEELRATQKQVKVIRVEVTQDNGDTVIDAGIQHNLFPKLVKMLSAKDHKGHRLNVWIAGPAGTGKTSAVEHGAKALSLDFSSTGALTDSYKIFGFISPGTGDYVATPFRKIWENGGVFLFDDCDGSDPAVLVELNNALANGGCTFPDGYVKRHADCCIVLTANTWGLGATNDYVGRMKQDAAFLDRFVKIYWPIDEDLEIATAPNEGWTMRVQAVRANVKEKGLKVLVTPRASYYGAALLNAGLSQDDVEMAVLKASMSEDQWRSVC